MNIETKSSARQPVFVLVGGTGDLAKRMLWPSLAKLEQDGFLAKSQRIISISREKLGPEDFATFVSDAIVARLGKSFDTKALATFIPRLTHLSLDINDAEWGAKLKAELGEIHDLDIVFFLSTSPSLFSPILAHIKKAAMNLAPNRLIVEKPLGHDLPSSVVINDVLADVFDETRLFRIDHYLGKETVQNLLALRFGNTVFEPLWNSRSIDHVQITIAESLGVADRLDYYDNYGALKDMVQNHLLQLVCLVAMEPPAGLSANALRDEKVKVLKSLKTIDASNVVKNTARGQYGAGYADGQSNKGYEFEKGSPSNTETFVAIKAEIANWRWAGTPFYLRTGKCLPSRKTEIVIQFRPVPHSIFGNQIEANRLVIRLQPEEDISLTIMNKSPGLTFEGLQLQPLALSLSLAHAFDEGSKKSPMRRIAYERLILDALHGNNAHFVRRDEVEAAWKWVDGIAEGWKKSYPKPHSYPAGTFGPVNAYTLFDRDSDLSWLD